VVRHESQNREIQQTSILDHMTRHARLVDLPLRLGPEGPPIRHRIADAVLELLRSGALRPGDTLPPSRALAADLGVSRTAVLAAYDELTAAGFIHAVAGSATVVSAGADLAAQAGVSSHAARPALPARGCGEASPWVTQPRVTAEPANPVRWRLVTGYPDTSLIDPGAWRAAWRAAARYPVSNGVTDSGGPLREALATHLRRTRGVVAEPDDIVLVPGVSAALRALVRAAGLADQQIGFEEPGYPEGRRALESAGARITPVRVDEDGLDTADLPGQAAVYTTPAHQYPLGARLSAARRATLIRWARETGALVIEDDYDGEFRFDVRGLPALHGMTDGPDVVAYVGTASKVLSPGLRIAWVVAPGRIRDELRDCLTASEETVSVTPAQAVASFITAGNLARHLARTGRTYAARRRALLEALRGAGLAVTGVDAGLHLVAWLPPGTDEAALRQELLERGLAVDILSDYCMTPHPRQALVCGYALLPETQAAEAATVIAEALR
jgi:GntR family transcriptional regulator/MocR family aminotransferase